MIALICMVWNPKKKFTLHDGSEDTVVTFDFKQSLLSLLRDSSLMSDENMLFSGDTPYESSTLNCEIYSDINSSDRYHQIQSYKPLHSN